VNEIRALVWKDLQIHARSIALHLLGWIVAMRMLVQAQHSLGFTQGQSLASMIANTSLALFPIFAIYSAQWLVERERGKETFAWIRTLPVSDGHIVLAKFAASLAICLIVGLGWWLASIGIDFGLRPWQLASVWLVWCVFAGVSVCFQVLFSGRLAGGTPAALAFVAGGIALYTSRSPDAVVRVTRMWSDPSAHVWLWLACVAVEAGAMAATYARFHAQDSHHLVE
jgi:ABC-type transport system involved in multi-copper enzyme maturation permease subunit